VKIACAAVHPTDIYGYMDCKDEICKRLEANAVTWQRKRSPGAERLVNRNS
jgi:hypothetical protein